MLNNDPPSGTKVRFTRDYLSKAKANDIAVLVGSVGRYSIDRPEDEFEIDFRGERLIVARQYIEEAGRRESR